MGLWKLRLSMYGTLTVIIMLSTLFFTIVLTLVGALNILLLAMLVVVFNILQWLFAPKIIDSIYRTREVSPKDNPKLYNTVKRLSEKIGLKMPKVMIAQIPIPNAFAYGSPLTGSRVAITSELLKVLEDEEVEAVIGHELGHLKHRDVQIMMFVSVLPAIFYFIGYSLMLSGWFGGYRSRNNAGYLAILGIICLVVYWILSLFVLGLSRYREYYADRRSATTVDDGARKLSEALAKIVHNTSKVKSFQAKESLGAVGAFKSLFISDPDRAEMDEVSILNLPMFRRLTDQQLVNEILSRKITFTDRIMELFSSHPNIVKRLKALKKIEEESRRIT